MTLREANSQLAQLKHYISGMPVSALEEPRGRELLAKMQALENEIKAYKKALFDIRVS